LNKAILNIEIQEFINRNINSDITSILLKGTQFSNIQTKEIVAQIEAKKRCKTKLSSWFKAEKIYYPNKLNIEQTSSEITADYKAKIIEGNSIIDLTGGFGVDCYYFSKQFKNVIHCEIDKSLSEIADHNFEQLQVSNVETKNIDGISFLNQTSQHYDWIYIDPSRRHDSKGKVFFLKDCLPNVPKNIETLFKHSKNILIKTSPLLDISVGINELKHVKSIHIVAVSNEVKEILWILEDQYDSNIIIQTVNKNKDKQECFSFILNSESSSHVEYSIPLAYLYEPNVAILKSGAFKTVSAKLNLFKLHQHSHLYTSEELIDFPGRCFKITYILPYNKQTLKKASIIKANITTRNFPQSVEQIRKRFKIKDGGKLYLFFTTNIENKHVVLVCEKIL